MLLSNFPGLGQNVSDIISESNDNFAKEEQTEADDEIPIELQRLIDHPIEINSGEIEILVKLNLI